MEQLKRLKQQENRQQAAIPLVYRVTAGSLAKDTKISYQRHINEFLAHFHITDINIVRDWSLKLAS
jgi:hypothetical protein